MQTDIIRPSSSIRRKPVLTYKSPSATEWSTFSPQSLGHPRASTQPPRTAAAPRPPHAKHSEGLIEEGPKRDPPAFKAPLLPLYHPMGPLALSLPPLDPASFGLPLPPLNYNEPQWGKSRASSSRARRASAAVPTSDVAEYPSPAPLTNATVSAVAAVAAREIKDRASPRKRRQGSKRKRKDAEDTDATYPAKRTRLPRGITTAVEEESPAEADSITPEDVLETESLESGKKPVDRRTTRSAGPGGAAKRRGSSEAGSETPSNDIPPGDDAIAHDIEKMKKTATPTPEAEPEPKRSQEEKEEGELSDDGQ